MIKQHTFPALDEAALARLAELLAFSVRLGDLIALHGDLGAGKTTFARAFITALAHPEPVEVPSPTFTLVQSYDTARIAVAHYDLYRLDEAAELDELGLEDALGRGAALVEWPERAAGRLSGTRLDLALAETADGSARDVTLTAAGSWGPRLARLAAIRAFLACAGHASDRLLYLQGDASVRRYARLCEPSGGTLILMDWPPQPDGPPIRDGKPYSAIAHLAEGVRPFVAIAGALSGAGLSVPEVHAADLDGGLLLIEDFGDRVFGEEMRAGTPQADLWRAAVDILVTLRAHSPPRHMALADGAAVTVPRYDADAMGIETELLLDWYWPAVHGAPPPPAARAEYMALWSQIFARLAALPHGWALRDFHSPNLLWLPGRPAPRNVGLIDFQDAQIAPHAYDLVSLTQDARVDVPAELQVELLDRYCRAVTARDPAFDEAAFRWSHAALGAQRNSKILGIFARLAHRDGKPRYLAHIPRLWRYLAADLAHADLAPLRAWFEAAFPAAVRARSVPPLRVPSPMVSA